MKVPMKSDNTKEYLAFISYRHTDIEWAEWLQNKLAFYRNMWEPVLVKKARCSNDF